MTIVYFNFLPWTQLTISAAALVAAIGSGIGLCRFAGGVTRKNLLATSAVTQIVFLMAYLANIR
jgi:F0F1-type ATP synthase membrane subunit c/vacuolar-type H+-ATPase subunit K